MRYIRHEAEGRFSMRDMFRNDLEHEMQLQAKMREQIPRAHELGDFGTVEILEEVLLDREDLACHLYSILEDDTLVRGMTHLLQGGEAIHGRKADNERTLQ